MNTVEVLQKARDLISDPKRWTQGGYGGGQCFFGVDVADLDAECFCAIGACSAVSGLTVGEIETGEIYRLLSHAAEQEIIDFNDTHTHAEVLAAFDRAIENAKASAGAA